MADWASILKIVLSFIQKQEESVPAPVPAAPQPQSAPAEQAPGIDWTNPECMVSKYFSVKDCLWLHQWNRLANDSDGLNDTVKANLIALCATLDQVREYVGLPFSIHCIYRSSAYSVLVGGSPTDVHTKGMAIDFHVNGMTIDDLKEKIRPVMAQFNIRMEKGTTTWVHVDTRAVGPSGREFTA